MGEPTYIVWSPDLGDLGPEDGLSFDVRLDVDAVEAYMEAVEDGDTPGWSPYTVYVRPAAGGADRCYTVTAEAVIQYDVRLAEIQPI